MKLKTGFNEIKLFQRPAEGKDQIGRHIDFGVSSDHSAAWHACGVTKNIKRDGHVRITSDMVELAAVVVVLEVARVNGSDVMIG